MSILMFITLYPFWFSIIGSFNEGLDYMRGGVNLWPRKWTLANYRAVLSSGDILQAYKVTVLRTIVGTVTHLVVTSMFAYAFSRRNLVGKKVYATMGVITMFFHGGLIPNYLLFKTIGILNTFWVYIFPALFNFFNVVIFASFFRNIPESINESARMDGANEYTIYTRLIVPLSKPVFAALALFTGVYHWNDFFMSLVFTNDKALEVMQVFLLRVIQTREVASQMAGAVSSEVAGQAQAANSTTIQLATMVIAAAPILALYPFLQKYFVKGVLIGSIKG
jgi:putative aldouronate transport system permease protein